MALINCPYCGNRVSSLAPVCVYCGSSVSDLDKGLIYEVRNKTLVKYHGDREVVSIPGYVEEIGRGAFEDCTSIVKVIIGNNIKVVNDFAFSGCTSLETIVIGEGVANIGFRAFAGCSSLQNIELPHTVDTIDLIKKYFWNLWD